MKMKSGVAPFMGHEKEPPQPHGPKMTGRPLVHSHSARPKRALKTGGRKPGRRAM